ncbi:hypothetical protein LIER_38769 [Lithospermum erythrorhizon]|uniref:Uncharacterized protein n=1 Tax=Lithospermum erythrorhizon TaxID=34254 RepID=A0AAV3Q610_LITER
MIGEVEAETEGGGDLRYQAIKFDKVEINDDVSQLKEGGVLLLEDLSIVNDVRGKPSIVVPVSDAQRKTVHDLKHTCLKDRDQA